MDRESSTERARQNPVLRLLVCGSSGSGKSTLIDRLAREANDQLVLVDAGDADCRSMVELLEAADALVILVDASEPLPRQSLLTAYLGWSLGVGSVILAVNKLDACEYPAAAFEATRQTYSLFMRQLGCDEPRCVPISARAGDNLLRPSSRLAWYLGLTLADAVTAQSSPSSVSDGLPAAMADQFQVQLLWIHQRPMLPGRGYLLQVGATTTTATITALKHKLGDGWRPSPAKRLDTDDIGVCNISVAQKIQAPTSGGFTLVDRTTGEVAGVGLLQFALRRAENIHWQALSVDKLARAQLKGQRPCLLWFTGLSGAGKSSIANLVEKKLYGAGCHTYLLDGDNVRHGLNRDLGFTDADRVENIRRVAELGKLFVDAGLITLVAFISPFRSERSMARQLLAEGEFLEIFVDTPLAEAEKRDPKGLYKKARSGSLKHFTGIDSPYEPPENPELHIDTTRCTAEQAADLIVEALVARGNVRKQDVEEPLLSRYAI